MLQIAKTQIKSVSRKKMKIQKHSPRTDRSWDLMFCECRSLMYNGFSWDFHTWGKTKYINLPWNLVFVCHSIYRQVKMPVMWKSLIVIASTASSISPPPLPSLSSFTFQWTHCNLNEKIFAEGNYFFFICVDGFCSVLMWANVLIRDYCNCQIVTQERESGCTAHVLLQVEYQQTWK